MAMKRGQRSPHVYPSLHARCGDAAPQPTAAVQKATRYLDNLLFHTAQGVGVSKGYQVPKSCMKAGGAGTCTVEIEFTSAQVDAFFGDDNVRKAAKVKMTAWTILRPLLVWSFAFMVAQVHYDYLTRPTLWDQTIQYIMAVLISIPLMLKAIPLRLWMFLAETFSLGWTLFNAFIHMWISQDAIDSIYRVVEHNCAWVKFAYVTIHARSLQAQKIVCSKYYSYHFCPLPERELLGEVKQALSRLINGIAPVILQASFWQSLLVFYLVGSFVSWLTAKRTYWVVRLSIDSQAFSVAQLQTIRAMNEATSDKIASCPILTAVVNHVQQKCKDMPIKERDRYQHVCTLVASAWAANRARLVHSKDDVDEPPPLESCDGSDGNKEVEEFFDKKEREASIGKRLIRTRTSTAPHNVLRPSVRVKVRTWAQLFDDVQLGIRRMLPGADLDYENYCGLETGPQFFDVTAAIDGGLEDEVGGISRHLRCLISTVTNDFLDRTITPEATARLNASADVIADIVATAARENFNLLTDWKLPQKWGNSRETWYERIVCTAGEFVRPILTGFVKTGELALSVLKLPRLVGSTGKAVCAKEAVTICAVESLFKKLFPQLVVKGKNQKQVRLRFRQFARRARRHGKRLVSIDMSAMDSSITIDDRARIRKVIEAVANALRGLLECDLQDDHILRNAANKEAVRWVLQYIEVKLKADDSVLFSGERGTSIDNRICMLIIYGAELIRVYGAVEGERKIRKMFECPPAAHDINTDEHPDAGAELIECDDGLPDDDADVDVSIGDGDDNTLAVHHAMYKSETEFVLAWEEYHKLVEVCSAWDENVDMECLSLMCIHATRPHFIPNVKRNIQRLVAHKVFPPRGTRFAEGCETYEPTKKEWALIATDLWQRSFSLVDTPVSRHLCRAMFQYAHSKSGKVGTVYNEDDKLRLGKTDGDKLLDDCWLDVQANSSGHVSTYAMVKACMFKHYHKLTYHERKSRMSEFAQADRAWQELQLDDELCADPDTILANFPISPRVAELLGMNAASVSACTKHWHPAASAAPHRSSVAEAELGWHEDRPRTHAAGEVPDPQLAKADVDSPEVGSARAPGGGELCSSDSDSSGCYDFAELVAHRQRAERKAALEAQVQRASSVLVYEHHEDGEITVLSGFEPDGKPRAGMLSVPGGKLEDGEDFLDAAVRELREEALLDVGKHVLKCVRTYTCGSFSCKQFSVPASQCFNTQCQYFHSQDVLKDLRFRTADKVMQDTLIDFTKRDSRMRLSQKLSRNLLECIVQNDGTDCSVSMWKYVLSACDLFKNTSGKTEGASPQLPTTNRPKQALGVADSEVKAGAAAAPAGEPGGVVPSNYVDVEHTHDCPVCGQTFTHKHLHYSQKPHKPWQGQCPNSSCEFSTPARPTAPTPTPSAQMSREAGTVRQFLSSSSSVGYGTVDRRSVAGENDPRPSQAGGAKSRLPRTESKGSARGRGKGKPPGNCCGTGDCPQVCPPCTPSQLAIVVYTGSVSQGSVCDQPCLSHSPYRTGYRGQAYFRFLRTQTQRFMNYSACRLRPASICLRTFGLDAAIVSAKKLFDRAKDAYANWSVTRYFGATMVDIGIAIARAARRSRRTRVPEEEDAATAFAKSILAREPLVLAICDIDRTEEDDIIGEFLQNVDTSVPVFDDDFRVSYYSGPPGMPSWLDNLSDWPITADDEYAPPSYPAPCKYPDGAGLHSQRGMTALSYYTGFHVVDQTRRVSDADAAQCAPAERAEDSRRVDPELDEIAAAPPAPGAQQ